jgi:hypothetical protein
LLLLELLGGRKLLLGLWLERRGAGYFDARIAAAEGARAKPLTTMALKKSAIDS